MSLEIQTIKSDQMENTGRLRPRQDGKVVPPSSAEKKLPLHAPENVPEIVKPHEVETNIPKKVMNTRTNNAVLKQEMDSETNNKVGEWTYKETVTLLNAMLKQAPKNDAFAIVPRLSLFNWNETGGIIKKGGEECRNRFFSLMEGLGSETVTTSMKQLHSDEITRQRRDNMERKLEAQNGKSGFTRIEPNEQSIAAENPSRIIKRRREAEFFHVSDYCETTARIKRKFSRLDEQ